MRMLMPLIYFNFVYFFILSATVCRFCNRNSIEESRGEAICLSEGQADTFFLWDHRVHYHAHSNPPLHVSGPQPQTLYVKTLSNIADVFIVRSPTRSV
jgi:hypothetical protein